MRVVLVLVLAGLGFVTGCGGGDETVGVTTTSTSEGCASVEAPGPRAPETLEPPSAPLGASKTYRLVFETSCGPFTVTLDQKLAPKATASLVALASDGFFDATIFHRVVPGFVVQGGDPTQSGSGGPGYSTVDVPPAGSRYLKGVVAMAKSALEAPGTAGSQFFVVSGADAGLPPEYAIVGNVTSGLEAVERIDALGTGDGPPSQPVVVSSVTVDVS